MERHINYIEEKERCKDFLQGFVDDLSGQRKYQSVISRLAARRDKVLTVDFDDLLAVRETNIPYV